MKRTRSIILISTLVVALIIGNVVAYADSNSLSIYAYQQEEDSWCWAACMQSVLEYYGDSESQSDIVTTAFGEPINWGASLWNVLDTYYSYGYYAESQYSALDFNEVVAEIDSGRPIHTSSGYHARLIIGYYTYGDSEYVEYIEPENGSIGLMEYDEYVSSFWSETIYNIFK